LSREASRIALVIEISSSSDEEDFLNDVARGTKFAKQLFGDLNRDFLRPPDDDKVIVISNFDEETEAREETPAEAKVAPSAAAGKSSTPTASPTDVDENPRATPNDSSDGLALGPKMGKDSNGGHEAGVP
jgi:hypothetical protein